MASDWLAKAYEDWLYAVYSAREAKEGGGQRTPAGWGQGRAEIECVGVFVLRWQGLKPGEERVGLSVSGTLSS